ncbi:putative sodium/proline symporter [Actinobacillus pleuropneumoniae]|nr:putative sodium/proline symporter [Actinobacillus pleuropneumoniae]KIE93615.1 putative sodium/proline symporter [Actinobacillus pleuropneumoniae]KIE93811.1 putative sodium/proline symporter [Actinobacillus pleuropneumoniae]KIE98641.1 putative sodium/proline symporter [Actinobacillus pleuropneumoniae]KIF00245.1 putative sodium/proline symporter [Actinobacillus pleuropneumoniae]
MFNFDPTTITFIIYIIGMIAIGFIAYRVTNNLSDYILGGRRLGSFVTALSAGASDMSGWLLMGLPGAVYSSGLIEGWLAVGLTIGLILTGNWSPVVYVHTPNIAAMRLRFPNTSITVSTTKRVLSKFYRRSFFYYSLPYIALRA